MIGVINKCPRFLDHNSSKKVIDNPSCALNNTSHRIIALSKNESELILLAKLLSNRKSEKKPHKILLTDSRDVVFQSNIFDHSFKRPLNFFLESEKIMNDPRNVRWLKRTVGQQIFEKIKDNLISCSGTTLGNFDEIMNYIKLMKKNLYLFPYKRPLRHIISLKKVEPYDQGIHNYLIYSNFFKDVECHKNNVSKICTTAYMKNFRFNKEGQLLNDQDDIYSVIHQYDRSFYDNGSPVFNFKKIYE